MDPIVRKTLLYDFYGELLTDHQKRVFEDSVFQDLSYSEIASEMNTSRQAVYDLLRRSEKILEDYENKLGLMQRFLSAKERFQALADEIRALEKSSGDDALKKKLEKLQQTARSIEEDLM